MKKCPGCNKEFGDSLLFCPDCGKKLEGGADALQGEVINEQSSEQDNNNKKADTFALVGMIIGICSVAGMFIQIPIISAFPFVLSVLGIVFSAIGKKSEKRKKMAKAGLILSIIALSVCVLGMIVKIAAFILSALGIISSAVLNTLLGILGSFGVSLIPYILETIFE